ncbi:hypothetical protein J5N97_023758 [Dioscorea zingiberensis]|uniref:Uncharacterized protein n=1 Tax=Dioscorea zingiberensis TaxID=325984 RepID=A0A9D5H841_9LILI|nr:hypothetical protein J5N97_023758 [Dioscorea zingiberensis]
MVEALSEAYDALVTASLDVVEARGASSGQRAEEADAALEEFKRRWELFKAACDEADQVVGSARLRLELETVADHHEKLNDCSAVAELIVKEQMKKEGQRGKDRYIRLLKLLMDLRDRRPNEYGHDPTLQHIRRLLYGYPYLIAELNAFLPNVCKLDLIPNYQSRDPKPISTTLDDGVRFVRMVADRLSEEKFKRFLVLLDQSRKTGSPYYNEIQKLLSDHADLIQNFEVFKQEKACGIKRRHAGSSHAVTGTMIDSTAVQSKRVQKQNQDGIGSKAGNSIAIEDHMYELDMRCEWYSQLHREIKKYLDDKQKGFKSGFISSEMIQLEDYLFPKSITCMKDLFGGSGDDVMEYLNEKGVETLSHVLRHLEWHRERTLFRRKARWLWARELSQLRQLSRNRKLAVLKRRRQG